MSFIQKTIRPFLIICCLINCLNAQSNTEHLNCCTQWFDSLVVNPYNMPPAEAILQLDEAITALRKQQSVHNIALAKCLLVKANYLSIKFNFRESTTLAQEAETVFGASNSSDADLEILGWIYNLIAYNAEQRFDSTTAILYSKKTQALARKLHILTAVVNEYNNLCKAYTNLGDFNEASVCVDSGKAMLDTLRTDDAATAVLLSQLKDLLNNSEALLYFRQSEKFWNNGRISKSTAFNEMAIQKWSSLLENMQRERVSQEFLNFVYANLGSAFQRNRYRSEVYRDSAFYLLQQADTLFARRPSYSGNALHGFVKSLLATSWAAKDPEKAMNAFNDGLSMLGYYPTQNLEERRLMLERAPAPERLLMTLLNQANAYTEFFYQKDPGYLQQSLAILNDLVQDMEYLNLSQLSSDAIVAQRNLLESIYLNAIKTSVLLFEQTNDLSYFEQAFSFMEKHKSFILRQGIRKRYYELQEEDNPKNDILAQEAFLEKEYQDLRYQLTIETSASKKEQLIDRIIEHRQRRQSFIDDLKNSQDQSKQALFFDRHDHATPALKTVKEIFLEANEALITYSIGANNPMALVIWKDNQLVVRLTIDDVFWKSFDKLQQCAQNECASDEYAAAAYDVYEHLMKNVVAQLPNQITTLLIVPDNELRALSFDLLLTKATTPNQNQAMPFLIHNYALKYCYSVGTMAWINQLKTRQTAHKRKDIAGFIASPGDRHSGYASCSQTPLPDLSKATKKMMTYFPKAERDLFVRATRTDFIQHCHQYQILHITAHGCTNEKNPMDYYLQFAQDRSTSTANKLTVKYIYDSLNVKADLLVLASCNTENGNLEGGEGLASISRAFIQNGVGQVLVTLHEVNDYTSAKLLLFFYEELTVHQQAPTVALAKAKRKFLNDSTIEDQFKAPNFWSNFVLIGDD
jgi:CHAT domain-containing protein